MLHYQMVIPQWLALDMSVRLRLKEIFNIPRSEGTSVVSGVVTCDGHTHADLRAITQEKINAFLGEESTDFYGSLEKVIEKVLNEQAAAEDAEAELHAKEQLELVKEQRKATLDAVHKLLEATAPLEEKKTKKAK